MQLSPDFEQETFNQLAPPDDDPWYDEPSIQDVDVRDLSWPNRRKFAAGRVARPPLILAEMEAEQAAEEDAEGETEAPADAATEPADNTDETSGA